MSIKHIPAMPLPWHRDDKHADVIRGPEGEWIDMDLEDYAIHAANAYPKLVEALRVAALGLTNGQKQRGESAQSIALSVLRELGEAS